MAAGWLGNEGSAGIGEYVCIQQAGDVRCPALLGAVGEGLVAKM